MALKSPALCADLTETSGTGTYTLNDEAAPGLSLRTLADAVATGFVSPGDTVHYCVKNTLTQGSALLFERGIGTVGAGGLTLARTTIKENHLGTQAAVDWVAGGARTMVVGTSPDAFPQVDAANTFTAAQTFTGGLKTRVASGIAVIDNSTAASATGTDLARFNFYGNNSAAAETLAAFMASQWVDNTAGSVDSILRVVAMLNSVPTVAATFNPTGITTPGVVVSGSTLTVGGTAVALQGVLSAPSGTKLLLGSTSLPTGWTVVGSTSDKTILTTETIGEGGATGGSWTISGLTTTVDNATVTVAATVLDQTNINHVTGSGGGLTGIWKTTTATGTVAPGNHTHTTTAHNHTASTTAGNSWRPAWVKFLVIVKS